MDELIGFGADPGFPAVPALPADYTPVSKAELDARLAEQSRKSLMLTIMVGLGATALAVGITALVLRR